MTAPPFSHWPFDYEPRPNQVKALEWLTEQTAKYIILEAPVGSGKSNLGLAYSSFLSDNKKGSSYILTPQRILQEQYETSFKNIPTVPVTSFYGKGNYTCANKGTNCEIGSIVKPACNDCPYSIAKARASRYENTVMNYTLALLAFGYTNMFSKHTDSEGNVKKRKLMVFDECHTLEQHLVEFDAVKLTYARCKKYDLPWKVSKTLDAARQWAIDAYLPKVKKIRKDMEYEVDHLIDRVDKTYSSTELRKMKEYNILCDHVDEVQEICLMDTDYLNTHFVLVHDATAMTFKRLKGAYTFHKILDDKAERFLFMSSTILNKDGFCRDLGINPEDAAFLSMDSEFPVENRPIVYIPQMKMNATWADRSRAGERKQMLSAVIELLNAHEGDSGLIHTANFKIAEWLVDNLRGQIPHTILHHNPQSGDDRNTIINAFLDTSTPSVLISPSSTEGLDLKEDLGRFSIFVKVPFGFLGDQWIKKRMEMSQEWYQRRAVIDVIQGGGRVVRSADDKGNVYILDASWAYLYSKTAHIIPNWWKESYNVID
jgi:Rad3-related DNA helicase